MKYLMRVVLTGGLMTALWSMPALRAEEHAAGMKDSKHHEMMGERMKEKLGLSDDQAEKLKTAMKAHWDAVKPLHQQMKEAMQKLKTQITSKNKDSEIQATLDQLTKTRKSMQAEHEKFTASLNSFLTPTQRGKMALSMMKHMHGHNGHHEGHEASGDHANYGGGDQGSAPDMKDSPSNEVEESEGGE